eukprot:GHVU01068106.1.p2 GENE.GHVU01068106.1~~GHVU01068106.1.p2  ORF type:complete len:147 (-),score=4.44 GHVU01068106.1:210-650(-)
MCIRFTITHHTESFAACRPQSVLGDAVCRRASSHPYGASAITTPITILLIFTSSFISSSSSTVFHFALPTVFSHPSWSGSKAGVVSAPAPASHLRLTKCLLAHMFPHMCALVCVCVCMCVGKRGCVRVRVCVSVAALRLCAARSRR